MHRFPFVDRYMGLRLDLDLATIEPGQTLVVESERRLRRETSYGYLHGLWWVALADGRSAASVPPGAGEAVAAILEGVDASRQLEGAELAARLRGPVDAALAAGGLGPTDRAIRDVAFACNADLLRRHRCGDCRRLLDESIPPAEGIRLPGHCFPDGIVYGVVCDGEVVSCAHAHRPGVLEGQVADLGVPGTALPHRRRGYARACVSAVVEHITRTGGEARYGCSPTNLASIATARACGFVLYGTQLILSAPRPG